MQNLDTSAAINRFISQPDSVDIADLEGGRPSSPQSAA